MQSTTNLSIYHLKLDMFIFQRIKKITKAPLCYIRHLLIIEVLKINELVKVFLIYVIESHVLDLINTQLEMHGAICTVDP